MRVPLHLETAEEARQNGCLDEWRESYRETVRCRLRMDQLIAESFDGMHLKVNLPEIICTEFGRDRVMLVLANAVRLRDGDGRFRPNNYEWAENVALLGGTPNAMFALNSHFAIVNGLIDDFRKYAEQTKEYRLVNIFQPDQDQPIGDLLFHGYSDVDPTAVKPERYRCVFRGYVYADCLEDVYIHFNEGFEGSYQGYSLSVGDLVELVNGSANEAKGVYYVDSFGFVNLPDFDTSQCQEMKGLRTVMIQSGCPPVETRIQDGREKLQRAVSGQGEQAFFEITYPFDDNAVILGNEEAKLKHMAGTRRIEGSIYAGPLYILGDNGQGEFIDLTQEQVDKYLERFADPEYISDEEVEADCGFTFITLE